MQIRAATADDWPAIWEILRRVGPAGQTLTWDEDATPESVRPAWMLPPPGRTVVAVDGDGTVVGTALTRPNHSGRAAHVANASFVVHPDHSGRGIGRALGRHVLDQARADGYRAMQFNAVVETNTRAVRLWRSFGFDILATVPEAFDHPTHGLVGLHIMYRRL
jgi:L-amino acid N-acyltransferase YncA